MPVNFMLWYFNTKVDNEYEYNKFLDFRKDHGDKIKAVDVVASFPPVGGRKKRKQTRTQQRRMRMRTRSRRQKRTRNRNPRK